MGGMIIVAAVFAAGFLAIFAFNLIITDLFQKERTETQNRLREELRARTRQQVRESIYAQKNLSELAEEAYQETALGAKSFRERLRSLTEQAGLNMSLERLVAISAGAGLPIGIIVGLLTGSVVLGIVLALICAAIPWIYVSFKRQQRLEQLRAQLPDCFDLMGRTIRSGQTISQGMKAVADEFKAPAGIEFAYCFEQQNLGLSAEVALQDLSRRTGLLEIKIFVLALLVHRQTGGNLAELLDKLSDIVRARFRLRGKIKSLTAEGRLQGVILLGLPLMVYGLLLIVSRPYALKLFDHPVLPIVTLIMMSTGALWIRKIVNFDF
jgi:tight adherence protein B